MIYFKLSDIRLALEETLGRSVSRSLAHDYTTRKTFPHPAIAEPVRLWREADITEWLTHLSPR